MNSKIAPAEPIFITIGSKSVPVEFRVNRRSKRLILKVDTVLGRVLITVPSKHSIPEALAFAKARTGWLDKQLDNRLLAKSFSPDNICPFKGGKYLIVNEGRPRNRIKLRPTDHPDYVGHLIVGGEPVHSNRRIVDWMKKQARLEFTQKSDFYCKALNATRGSISIRDTRTRWGSCSSDGTLSYSWRLILAPPWILNYVAAHECTHLIHLNHSPDYWKLLKSLDVKVEEARQWFEDHGEELYSYGVEISQAEAA